MSVSISLLTELNKGFYIQRWNERIRPMDLIEIDKHAHKMMIAYCLGKYEEDKGNFIDWHYMIRDGICELLRRIIISDIKSPIYNKIKERHDVFMALNKFVYDKLEPKFSNNTLKEELREFLLEPVDRTTLTMRVIDAAHIYASYWEFQIIKHSNPFGYENTKIQTEMLNKLNDYRDIEGLDKLINKYTVSNFVDKCGQLRFQYRWAQISRITKTSVLGHGMMVALLSYLFVRENDACEKRIYNAFFGGLFHDLPEIVTRDIISPVKRSSTELDNLIKELEEELTEKEIMPLIENSWHDEMKYFIYDEFSNKIRKVNQVITDISTDEINEKYNTNEFCAYDGELIRAADLLSAFMEAWYSIETGIKNVDMRNAATKIKETYTTKLKHIGKVNLNEIYDNFELK